jgi:hypothetical protein
MSVERINGVLTHSWAKGSQLAILLILANHENHETGECYPSISTLVTESNLSRRAVQNVLKALKDNGELLIDPGGFRDGFAYANNYEIVAPRVSGDEVKQALQEKAKAMGECRVQSATRVRSATEQGEADYDLGEADDTPSLKLATDPASETAPQPEEEPELEPEVKPEKEPRSIFTPEFEAFRSRYEDFFEEPIENSGGVQRAFHEMLEEGYSPPDLFMAARGAKETELHGDLCEVFRLPDLDGYIRQGESLAKNWKQAAA